jgi:uncharacterized membrane protein YbhN (UPF0104 family)
MDNARTHETLAVRVIGYIIAVGAILLVLWYGYHNRHDLQFLKNLSYGNLFLSAVCVLVSYLLNSYQFHLFLQHFHLNLPPKTTFALTVAMILGNLLLPMRGGSGAMAVYLKSVYRLDFEEFGAIYSGTALLITLINSGMALIALFTLYLTKGFYNTPLSAVILCLFLASFYFSVFPPPGKYQYKGIVGFLFRVIHSWHLLSRNRGLLFRLAISLIATTLVLQSSFYFLYKAIGFTIDFSGVLIVSSLGTIANLVPITPGSIGFLELVTVNIPQLLDMSATRSIASAAIFRLITLFWAAIIGIPGIWYLARIRKIAGSTYPPVV